MMLSQLASKKRLSMKSLSSRVSRWASQSDKLDVLRAGRILVQKLD